MVNLLARTAKGRRPQAAIPARSSQSAGWQLSLGSETLAPCRAFIGHNLAIAKGLDNQYVPAGGSSQI